MKTGIVSLLCPFCGAKIKLNEDKGVYHTKDWGVLCSKKCYDFAKIAYARMILGKDTLDAGSTTNPSSN